MNPKEAQLALLRSYTQEFKSKFRRINSFTNHRSSIGTAHEGILRRFLQQYVPKRFAVSEGFIVDKEGQASNQCDIIIWSALEYSPFYQDGDFVILPIEAVHAVIEVKTSLTKKALLEAFKELQPIHQMKYDAYTAIFAFEARSIRNCLHNIGFDLDPEFSTSVDAISSMNGWTLQRLGFQETEDPELGTLGIRSAFGPDEENRQRLLPFLSFIAPNNDHGLDLAAFLGFLFMGLGIKENAFIELIGNWPLLLNSPIFPGSANIIRKDISPEEVKLIIEEYIDAVTDHE